MNAILLSLLLTTSPAADELRVLPESETPPARMLYTWLKGQVHTALDRRAEAFENLKTPDDIAAHQRRLREVLIQQLGGLPERTPLNAQTVGKLPGDGFLAEKVIFESRPNHHVTGVLFLPEQGKPPFPAVIIPSGHSATAKAADYNQKLAISLAKVGIAGFAYDPIGQGERYQLLGPDGKPKYTATTTEHFLIGVGSILVGRNTASYRVWDGMRAIDYLASRSDIDATKIGCSGCSGGGTLTSYLMAIDERVACAAPACYLTTFRRLIDTIGPQDSEQNIAGQIGFGLDHADYLTIRAPRPTLICSTTKDFFDIQGSWDTYRQAKRLYGRLGFPERVDLVETDGGHGVTPTGRATIVQWMRRWLGGTDGHVVEGDLPVFKADQLRCTPEGQVLRLSNEKSVFDLNAERAEQLAVSRRTRLASPTDDEMRRRIRDTAGVRSLSDLPQIPVREAGRIDREGYRIDKLIFEPEPGVMLPALAFVPAKPNGQATLYLHSDGKQTDAAVGGPIEKLVQDGQIVLAVDLRASGETSPGKPSQTGGAWKEFYVAYLLGRSLVGMRTEDVLFAARYLAKFPTNGTDRPVTLIATGELGVPALHAAALEPQLFSAVQLRRTLSSWTDVVQTPDSFNQFGNAIHGVLRVYDLPDLPPLAGKDKVTLVEPANATGKFKSSAAE